MNKRLGDKKNTTAKNKDNGCMIVIILSCMFSDENDKKTGLNKMSVPLSLFLAVLLLLLLKEANHAGEM